ncbi:Threonine--tRNA ligase [Candidatus Xenohaliotis californiensis]|uniref:Threonine--tRNA ligase n=1 Tax=Candidatus Xenohaliotis californiensis TaxID=84677 RepID=A0ABM9N9D6_9RICK|nr:Threonine--tRNA ligase [Candidatus Xenohaliotis californiensis]
MINIELKDGKITTKSGINGADIALSISKSLAKKAVAIAINGEISSLLKPIYSDAKIHIITEDDSEALKIMRHSTAHVMAEAVLKLFSNAKLAIGPTIKDGFYYDFDMPYTLEPNDLLKIENEMHKIISKNEAIKPKIISKNEAVQLFTEKNATYKLEIIKNLNPEEQISLFTQGEFFDLCKGPHLPSTGGIKAFKLLKLAGAYWQGDHNKPMLQRIYGTAWFSQKKLDSYLKFLEEVVKRDHRKLGIALDLFHFQEDAVGQVFWHTKGYTIYKTIESYIRQKLIANNYEEVKTPIIVNKHLWEKSGHWEKFQEHMLLTKSEKADMALKPMNCPCHVQIFNHKTVSYRDLPIRMAEFGTCHRNEPSGSLHGLMRVRGFVQDDAHIFCTMEQMNSEIKNFCDLLLEVYKDFGFHKVHIKFADRPEKRAGSNDTWNKAEDALRNTIDKMNLEYTINKGEGAFYGPKLEFVLKDALDRDWQCGTLQVDLVLPERLNAYYVNEKGEKQHPIMLHRAILGTFERFIGILLEEHSGKMPLWLAPLQIAVLTITNESEQYAQEIHQKLIDQGLHSAIDTSANKINYKIRKYIMEKVPLLLIIGEKEKKEHNISYRILGSDKTTTKNIDEFIKNVTNCITHKKYNIND